MKYVCSRTRKSFASVFILFVVLLISASEYAEARTWQNVTVITISGWEYSEMNMQYDRGNSFITIINNEGGRKNIKISDIQRILDSEGLDIMNLVISEVDSSPYKTTEEISEPSEVRSEEQYDKPISRVDRGHDNGRQLNGRSGSISNFRFSLRGGAGNSKEVGSWFEGLSSGLTYDVTASLVVTRDLRYIGVNVRHQDMDFDQDVQDVLTDCDYDEFGNYVCFDYFVEYEFYLREYYLVFGQVSPTVSSQHLFGYVEMGLGVIVHQASVTLRSGPYVETTESDESKFALSLTMGGTWPLTRNIGLNVETNMRLTGTGNWNPYVVGYDPRGSKGALFGIRVGLMAMLGN